MSDHMNAHLHKDGSIGYEHPHKDSDPREKVSGATPDPRDITERLDGYTNDDLRYTLAEKRHALRMLLLEAASTIAHLRGERDENDKLAREHYDEAERQTDRADRAEADLAREKADHETTITDLTDIMGRFKGAEAREKALREALQTLDPLLRAVIAIWRHTEQHATYIEGQGYITRSDQQRCEAPEEHARCAAEEGKAWHNLRQQHSVTDLFALLSSSPASDRGPTASATANALIEVTDSSPASEPPELHTCDWRFDGDDPYLVCSICHERRDALTGQVVSSYYRGSGRAPASEGEKG